jgi:hypothetical protein
MEMIITDPYPISLHGINLIIHPMEDGTYQVYKESRKIANIYAEVQQDKIVWDSDDWIDAGYINEIGLKIEEYETGNKR